MRRRGSPLRRPVSISEALGTSAELWLNPETTHRRHQRRLCADLGAPHRRDSSSANSLLSHSGRAATHDNWRPPSLSASSRLPSTEGGPSSLLTAKA